MRSDEPDTLYSWARHIHRRARAARLSTPSSSHRATTPRARRSARCQDRSAAALEESWTTTPSCTLCARSQPTRPAVSQHLSGCRPSFQHRRSGISRPLLSCMWPCSRCCLPHGHRLSPSHFAGCTPGRAVCSRCLSSQRARRWRPLPPLPSRRASSAPHSSGWRRSDPQKSSSTRRPPQSALPGRLVARRLRRPAATRLPSSPRCRRCCTGRTAWRCRCVRRCERRSARRCSRWRPPRRCRRPRCARRSSSCPRSSRGLARSRPQPTGGC